MFWCISSSPCGLVFPFLLHVFWHGFYYLTPTPDRDRVICSERSPFSFHSQKSSFQHMSHSHVLFQLVTNPVNYGDIQLLLQCPPSQKFLSQGTWGHPALLWLAALAWSSFALWNEKLRESHRDYEYNATGLKGKSFLCMCPGICCTEYSVPQGYQNTRVNHWCGIPTLLHKALKTFSRI